MKKIILTALMLGLLVAQPPIAQAQYNRSMDRSDILWQNTWQEFDYWLKRLDTNNLALNWEKRSGERWIRVYVDRSRWNAEPESNRQFLLRALNQDTRWPLAIQDADLNVLAVQALSSTPRP